MIIMLGQDSDHSLVAIRQAVEKGVHPHGLGYKFVNMLEEKHKHCDASVRILLSAELRDIQFKMANKYYNDVVAVLARFEFN